MCIRDRAETLQLPTVAVLAGVLAEPFRGQPGEALGVGAGIAEVGIYRLAQGQGVTHFEGGAAVRLAAAERFEVGQQMCIRDRVYAGAPRPLLRTPIYAADVHGSEGISGVEVHEPKQPLAEGNAVDYLIRTLRAAPEKSVTLAMLGPETNLALRCV